MLRKTTLNGASSLAIVGVLALAGAANAQQQTDPIEQSGAQADDEQANTVDEIIVTAQKREQSLQDVPVVVTAVSEQLLEDAGVRDIKDLQILVPGLTVTSTSNETITTARIRGISTVGDNPGLESSVLVIIDGVLRPRNGVGFGDLGELQRIEVLKGPQGTLFGKNASSGVINIISEPPSFDFGVEAEATVGNYGQRGVQASVTGPLVGNVFAGRLFVSRRERDGFLDVETGPGPRTLREDVDQDFYTIRGQLLGDLSEQLTLRVIADYTSRDENCCLATQLFVGQAANGRAAFINQVRPGSLDTTNTPFDRRAFGNRDTSQVIEDGGVSVQVDYDFNPDISLTSISAVRNFRTETGQDADYTSADLVYRPNDGSNFVEFGQLSQEVRLAGVTGRLNWIVGGFYSREEVNANFRLLFGGDYYPYYASRVLGNAPAAIGLLPGTVFQAGTGSGDRHIQNGESFAVFTDNTFAVTDQLNLTLGLRYTRDDKELRSRYTTTGSSCDQAEARFAPLAAAIGAAAALRVVGGLCLNGQNNDFDDLGVLKQERSEEAVTGTVKAAYDFTDDILAYASYSRGFKAGGFNLDREQRIVAPTAPNTAPNFTADTNTSFVGEFADSFELGVKSSLFSDSLLLNATLFHQTFTDFQLNTFVGTAFIVETLPEVISKGVDADFVYFSSIDGLSLQGGVTYADTTVSEFEAADLIDASRFTSLRRLPGERLSFAPLYSVSLAATYERPIGNGLELRGNVSGKYLSSYNTGSDLHPSKFQDAYTVVNARVGVGTDDGRYTLELFAQNLTDEDYLQVGFNGPFQVVEGNPTGTPPVTDAAADSQSVYNAFLGQPRTYGLTFRVRY